MQRARLAAARAAPPTPRSTSAARSSSPAPPGRCRAALELGRWLKFAGRAVEAVGHHGSGGAGAEIDAELATRSRASS